MKKHITIIMNLYYTFPAIIFLLFFIFCTQSNQQEKDLKKTINSEAKLNQFEYVLKQGAIIPYNKFREQFDYLSLIYLRDGYQPCYPTFIEWQQKIDSITTPDNHTLLFIIQGDNYSNFMLRVFQQEVIKDKFHINFYNKSFFI